MSGVNISSQQLHEILSSVTELTDLQLTQNPKLDVMTFATCAFSQLLRELRHHTDVEVHGAHADVIADARKFLNPTEQISNRRRWRVVAYDFDTKIRMATPDDKETVCFLVAGMPPPVDQ
jgi:hypothetical protein